MVVDIVKTLSNSLPPGWTIIPTRYLFNERNEKNTKDEGNLLAVSEYYGVAPKSDVVDDEEPLTRAATLYGYKIVHRNDIVMNIMHAWNGSLGVSDYDGITSPAYAVYTPNDGVCSAYYHHLYRTKAYINVFRQHSTGIMPSRWRLYPDVFFALHSICPPFHEQIKIANYLSSIEDKVLRIRNLYKITIEKIEEYKKSLIFETVTYGLNPESDVVLTDHPYIHQHPKHWRFQKIGYLFEERVIPAKESDASLSLSQKDGLVKTDDLQEHSMKTSTYVGWKHVIPGNIVLNRFKAHLGVFFCSKYEGMVSFHYGVYYPKQSLNPKFYEYLFHSKQYCDMFAECSNGITVGLQNLSNENFYSCKCVLPPIEEQNAIVDYLDMKIADLNKLISLKNRQIEKLDSYKKSLIYEYSVGLKRVIE